ncbi:PadR family transcriptional regulator [Candidatus Bathyarchaeota archaeon]|nr:PadR family transcriptional regulator [Candidatus Bathyarchaeota archaeon]
MVQIYQSFLRSLHGPIILWLLSLSPRHGYGIIKEIKKLTGGGAGSNTVYPYLHRLEKEGFIVGEWVEMGGRRVKRYSLTKRGEALLMRIREFFGRQIRELITYLLHEGVEHP